MGNLQLELTPTDDRICRLPFAAPAHGSLALLGTFATGPLRKMLPIDDESDEETASLFEPVIMPPATWPWLFHPRCAVQLHYPNKGAGVRPPKDWEPAQMTRILLRPGMGNRLRDGAEKERVKAQRVEVSSEPAMPNVAQTRRGTAWTHRCLALRAGSSSRGLVHQPTGAGSSLPPVPRVARVA